MIDRGEGYMGKSSCGGPKINNLHESQLISMNIGL